MSAREALAARVAGGDDPVSAALALARSGLDAVEIAAVFDAVLYEDHRDERRALGAHATPAALARSLVDETLDGVASDAPTVLDPACGSGVLLLLALRRLASARPDLDARELGARLRGRDLDPRMVSVARGLLEVELARLRAPATVVIDGGDGLDLSETVDVVLANPPWVSFAGRHGKPLDPATRARWFSSSLQRAWPTLHGLFLERAVALARRRVGVVLPDQVGHLGKYAALRAHVEAAGRVVVRYHGEECFDAVTPTLTLVVDRGRAGGIEVDGRAAGKAWTALPAAPIDVGRAVFFLGSEIRDCGIRTDRTTRHLVVPAGTEGAEPVLQGRDVSAWRCGAPEAGMLVGASHPRPLSGSEATFDAVTFVIRQTAAHPIVAPKLGARRFRNSLLGLTPPPPSLGIDQLYVVALLNSSTLRAMYQADVHESKQRAFPQVKVGSLRRLPLVLPTPDEHRTIVELAARRLAGDASLDPALDEAVAHLHRA